jgi:ATP-binding protein involved in chromosome partitioning
VKTYFEIVGDGGSGVAAQVRERRSRIEARLAGVRWRVAVGSGKGGVGKSTITLEVGRELHARGMRVAILDADLNGPAQARLAGVEGVPLVPGPGGVAMPRSPLGIGVVSLGALFPEPVPVEFASVAEGESHTWRAAREFSALAELLESVTWGELDLLLVDLPPGVERTLHHAEFLGPAAMFVLVTTPAELARGVVARSLAALGRTPNRVLGYIENMSGYLCPGCGTVRPLFPTSGQVDLGIPCLGQVPFDPALASLGSRGVESAAGRHDAVRRVVDRLLECLELGR